LLIIDWLIGIVLRPKFWVLPGTEGLIGYSDYAFHLRGFIKGTIGGMIGALILAGLAFMVLPLVR
jgi:hypothetical protein